MTHKFHGINNAEMTSKHHFHNPETLGETSYDNQSDNLTGLRDAKVLRLHTWACAHMDDYFHRELAKQGRLPREWTAPLDRQNKEEEEAS